jgi:hypothetical protein
MGFLGNKIQLQKEELPAAAVSFARKAMEICTLCRQTACWPQPILVNDDLHLLEQRWHYRIVRREIKVLALPVGSLLLHMHGPFGQCVQSALGSVYVIVQVRRTGLGGKEK